ncbi:MAG: VOC family protein [Litorimonas sp.]
MNTPTVAGDPLTSGVNHIGLTVKDLESSTSFFVDTLGWRRAGGVPDYPANFVTDGAIFVTLWQTPNPETATDFNRKTNVGLHHLALTVADVETLEELHTTLKADPKVRIEFGPELNGKGPTVHMMVYEPSGSRIEFAVPGGRRRSE